MALISAHRAADGGLAALTALAASGVDHVELDVRRRRDATFVVLHDGDVERDGLTLAACLAAIGSRAAVHLDLKLGSPPSLRERVGDDLERTWEVQVVRSVIDVVGDAGVAITSGRAASIRLLRRWAQRTGRPDLLVGLSLGRGVGGLSVGQAIGSLRSELFPARRMGECGANLVVAQKELALLTVARWARREGVPLLVWTVDTDVELRYWLARGRAWMVTTNRPGRALEIAGRG